MLILSMAEILHQLRLVVYPVIFGVLYIPGGCLGFLNHQQYYHGSAGPWLKSASVFLRLAADTAKFVVADLPKLSCTLVPVVAKRFPPGKKAARIVGGKSLLLSPNLVGLAPSSYIHGITGPPFLMAL